MELFPKYIKLDGHLVEVSELLKQTTIKADWAKDWLEFLKEWYNSSDLIEVKTSGSTGKPKSIQLRKEFVAASARRTLAFFELEENDKVLHCLPSRFIAGRLMTVRALIGKLDLKIVNPATDFKFLNEESFKFAAVVPNQMIKLLNPQLATRNLQLVLIGGSSILKSLQEKLQYVPFQCYSSYGMTETATHIALRKINGTDASDYYQCLDDIRVELLEDNCLHIHMPSMERSIKTNDIAKLKDNKTFKVLGRADHVIISGGIKYFPEEIEKKLEKSIKLPFYISSLPDDKLGQQIVIYVEATETPQLLDLLKLILADNLSKYERPRQIIFENEFNRTPTGKLIRT